MILEIEKPDWEENKLAELISKIRRSQYAKDCFADAKQLVSDQGYSMVVALAISWKYWGTS